MSSSTQPNGTPTESEHFAVVTVIKATTADGAYDFVTDLLDKPHPWEGPCSAAFVGSPVAIDYEEEYSSADVALAVLQDVPPMTRAQRAARLLAAHPEYREANRESVADAITDLLHFAERDGEDFESILETVRIHMAFEGGES